jgi:hypothetical protein
MISIYIIFLAYKCQKLFVFSWRTIFDIKYRKYEKYVDSVREPVHLKIQDSNGG